MEGIDGEGILRNQRGGELENWRMWFVFIQEQFYFSGVNILVPRKY